MPNPSPETSRHDQIPELNLRPDEAPQPPDRKDLFSRSYEAQGITAQSVEELLERLRLMIDDPGSLINDLERKIRELEPPLREAEKLCNELYDELDYDGRGEPPPSFEGEERMQELRFSGSLTAAEQNELAELTAADEAWKKAREDKHAALREAREKMAALQRESAALKKKIGQYSSDFFRFSHDEAFYCLASDDLRGLREKVDVRGKRVTTVASNGDVWQMFAEGGAEEIEIFDVSLPALWFSELKLTGLENLNFDDYTELFGRGKDDLLARQKAGAGPIDKDIYQKIRPRLSPQARTFFDGLTGDGGSRLASTNPWNGLIRYRENDLFIGDIIKDREEYERLRARSKQTRYSIRLLDINEENRRFTPDDVVFISNINYMLRDSLSLAGNLAADGATVLLTTSLESRLRPEFRNQSMALAPGTKLNSFGLELEILSVAQERRDGATVIKAVKAG